MDRSEVRAVAALVGACFLWMVSTAGCSDGGDQGDGGDGLSAAPGSGMAGPSTPAPAGAAQPAPVATDGAGGGAAPVVPPGSSTPATPPPSAADAGDATPPQSGGDMGAPDAGSGTPPQAPVSCPASALSAGVTEHSIDVGGVSRSFILQIPEGYTGDAPLPLVVDFHPLFGSGSSQRLSSGYAELADREGFIVAWPDGISGAWDVGPCCVDADDEAFARALVEEIRSTACVDPRRIYAAGYSMGGGFSHFAACNMADVFAAVAPAAFDLVEEQTCAPSRPISVLMFRGVTDFIVPYSGGPSTPPNGYPTMITFLGAEDTFARWGELDGCTGEPTDLGGGCQGYTQCDAGVEVTLCTNVPSSGHVAGDPEMGWEMFQRQPMP